MIRNLMTLPCLLALVVACGQGRTNGQDTGAAGGGAESGALPADTATPGGGIEDTTAAPSVDATDRAGGRYRGSFGRYRGSGGRYRGSVG
jgi:hypothetical protein